MNKPLAQVECTKDKPHFSLIFGIFFLKCFSVAVFVKTDAIQSENNCADFPPSFCSGPPLSTSKISQQFGTKRKMYKIILLALFQNLLFQKSEDVPDSRVRYFAC